MTAGETRRREHVEGLCEAAIRALSGETDLHFRGGRLHHADAPVLAEAPHLHPGAEEDFVSLRGIADGLALRRVHSDSLLHRRLMPKDPVARLVFEMLEQFRAESLVPPELKGVRRNMRHRHEIWSRAFHGSGLTETTRGMVLYTVAQIARSRLMREPVVEHTEDLLEATRFSLSPLLGNEVAALWGVRGDQQAFAEVALTLAEKVAELTYDQDAEEHDKRPWVSRNGFSLWVPAAEADVAAETAPGTTRSGLVWGASDYRAFTTAYDEEIAITDLVRHAQLLEHRRRLDEALQTHRINVSKLARALHALLTSPKSRGWDSAQEEGHIDGRRLTQLIASPAERRIFRTERSERMADSTVTFLVDCSGSMRRHQEAVAIIIDVFVRALELAGITSEVLGFTTRTWNGGRALRDWRRAGRAPMPGRLNELRHLVFKDIDTPWRSARTGLAGFLQADLFREGVDGEAVCWAAARMKSRPEARRLLVVVSDGSPMDSATSLVNDPAYLDQHLREVVSSEDAEGSVQVYGLGVGLDLSPYYSRRHALDLDGDLEHRALQEIITMLAVGARPSSAVVR